MIIPMQNPKPKPGTGALAERGSDCQGRPEIAASAPLPRPPPDEVVDWIDGGEYVRPALAPSCSAGGPASWQIAALDTRGFCGNLELQDYAAPLEPQAAHRNTRSCEPHEGLVVSKTIPNQAPALTIKVDAEPRAMAALRAVYQYIYTAWFTVREGWKSKRRIRQQWWYYKYQGDAIWRRYAPFYWLGDYAARPEDDEKFRVLSQALSLAGARMTSSEYNGQTLAPLTVVRSGGLYGRGQNDASVSFTQLRLCKNWWMLAEHEREMSLMAALLTGFGTGVRNRDEDDPLVHGTGKIQSRVRDAKLIFNAYNIAEWAKARFLKFGMTPAPEPVWDLRPDNSWKPIFPARLGGGHGDRPYTVWPKRQINHTQLKRAWDESWCQIESAMRFLFKLSYMSASQIEDMWNFGSGLRPGSTVRFNRGDARLHDLAYCMFERAERSVPVEAWKGGASTEPPSMRAWFGRFTPRRFLLVYRVMLCRTLRGEGRYKRFGYDDLWEHFRVYAKRRHAGYSTLGLAHLDGSVDLWAPFFDTSDENRRNTITHELFHYLVKLGDGGRPRDHKSSTHCSGKLNICYDLAECRNLAEADSPMARANINNYMYWLHERWRRWGSDWPPASDAADNESWHCDPIDDLDWSDHNYESVGDIGWSRLEALEGLFGEQGYVPWS